MAPKASLGQIVNSFKRRGDQTNPLETGVTMLVWQRGLYDHIIRDLADLIRVRECIADNPRRWPEDQYTRGIRSASAAERISRLA